MSRADELFIQNCRDILDNGFWDTELQVRHAGRTPARARTRLNDLESSTVTICRGVPDTYHSPHFLEERCG